MKTAFRQQSPGPGTERWIGPYRSIGRQPLDAELRAGLLATRRRGRRRVLWCFLPVPICAVLAAIAVLIFSNLDVYPSDIYTFPPAAGFVGIFIGLGLASEPVRRLGLIRRSLRDGVFERFTLAEQAASEFRALAAVGRGVSEDVPLHIDVFPETQLMGRTGGMVVGSAFQVAISTVAGVSTQASSLVGAVDRAEMRSEPSSETNVSSRIASPLPVVSPASGTTRELSAAEQEEIDDLVRSVKAMRRSYPVWAGVLVMALILNVRYLPTTLAIILSVLVCAAAAWWFQRNGLWFNPLIRNLRRAKNAGVVKRVSREDIVNRLRAKGLSAGIDQLGVFEQVEEFEQTGLVWTVDGAPAPWRVQALSRVRSR